MKELADKIGVTQMSISHYESGERYPNIDTTKALAEVFGVRVTDFISTQNDNLIFNHGEFRKSCKLSIRQQDYIKASIEEYLNRFFLL